jgi:hypothetical protein
MAKATQFPPSGEAVKKMMICAKAMLPTAAVATMLMVAPAAHADNQSFLDAMNAAGLSSQDGASDMLRVGKGACGLMAPSPGLMFGRSPNLVADLVWRGNPMLERPEAAVVVNAALDNLCPGATPFPRAS